MKRKIALLSLIFFIIGMLVTIVPYTIEGASQTKKSEDTEIIYHGNVSSKIFHSPSCRYYNCKNCTKKFTSREEAIKAGYRPCKICNP